MAIKTLTVGDGLMEIKFPTLPHTRDPRERLLNRVIDIYNNNLIPHQSNLEINFDFSSHACESYLVGSFEHLTYGSFDKNCKLYTRSNNNITRFDNAAIIISDKNEYNHYNIDSKLYYFIINNEEIPQNIPVMHNGYCNSILNKQIITKVILEYNREYGLFLNDYMNKNKRYLLQNRTMYEINNIARIFQNVGRHLSDGNQYY